MKTFDTLYSRKSVRSYTGNPPTDAQLEQILKAAWSSPVAMGRFEDMHLSVIRNQEIFQAIEKNMSDIAGREVHPLHGAPLLIVVSVKPRKEEVANNEYSSAAIIAHNMALASTALGLGSCDIWGSLMAANERADIVRMYDLPEGFVVCCGVIIGETDEEFVLREIPEKKIETVFLE